MSKLVMDTRTGNRSYANRGGRLRPNKQRILAQLTPQHGLPSDTQPCWRSCFPDCSELHVEIGCGSGEAAVHFARTHPNSGLVAFEVYMCGVASLLSRIEAEKLINLKVVCADAVSLLADWFVPSSLTSVRVFYPDPWPKRRHHKRRLINAGFLQQLGPLLTADGYLHLATDWPDYADMIFRLLQSSSAWQVLAHGKSDSARAGRLATRFETKALRAGRQPWDCRARYVRRGGKN